MKNFIKKFITSTVAIFIAGKLLEKYEARNTHKIANNKILQGAIYTIKKFLLKK